MKKGSKMMKEQRRKLSEAYKGQVAWNKGLTNADKRVQKYSLKVKGQSRTAEQRKKISEATKKAMADSKIRAKISEAKKGSTPWNKGKKGLQVSHMKGKKHTSEARLKMSEALIKRWNNQEYREQMSLVHKGKPSSRKGKKASEETRRKLSEAHKGKPSGRKGAKLTEDQKRKISEATKLSMRDPKIRKKFLEANKARYLDPIKLEKIRETSRKNLLRLYESEAFPKQVNTKIEKDIRNELLERGYIEGIDFIHQFKFMDKFMCDFCFPKQKIIIEAYGDFWHANPKKYFGKKLHAHQIKGINRDKSKEAYIKKADNNSWTYLYFWESDIKENLAKCVDKIEEFLINKLEKTSYLYKDNSPSC